MPWRAHDWADHVRIDAGSSGWLGRGLRSHRGAPEAARDDDDEESHDAADEEADDYGRRLRGEAGQLRRYGHGPRLKAPDPNSASALLRDALVHASGVLTAPHKVCAHVAGGRRAVAMPLPRDAWRLKLDSDKSRIEVPRKGSKKRI